MLIESFISQFTEYSRYLAAIIDIELHFLKIDGLII